jgi:putative membrane protein insertion efficiency factor
MRLVLLFLLRCYQVALSPLLGTRCRFEPSCSRFAIEAIEHHGPWAGSLLALRRIARCHPWHPGGYDPVPPGPRNGHHHP